MPNSRHEGHPCTQRPERSARAERFFSAVSQRVSKRPGDQQARMASAARHYGTGFISATYRAEIGGECLLTRNRKFDQPISNDLVLVQCVRVAAVATGTRG